MPTVRTTIEPWREVQVTDDEFLRLSLLGLIYTDTPPAAPPAFSAQQYAEMLNPASALVTLILSGIGAKIVAAQPTTPSNAQLWIETEAGGDPDAIRLYYDDGMP